MTDLFSGLVGFAILGMALFCLYRFIAWLAGPNPTPHRHGPFPPDMPLAELRQLEITARQIRQLVELGLLPQNTADFVLDRIAERRLQLRGQAPAAPTRKVERPPEAIQSDIPLLEPVPEEEPAAPPPRVTVPVEVSPPEPPPVSVHVWEPERTPIPEPAPTPIPAAPRRRLADVLTAFMEEKNILWGELVGGLLIVGCSIALVVSLWQTLAEIRYFPFAIMSGISLALFGAGLYTLHHWKLESTSRGLLAIAGLLVPLNLLVLAGLPRGQEGDAIDVAVSLSAVALFAWVLRSVGKVVAGGGGWLLSLAVVGTAGVSLVLPWLAEDTPEHGRVLLLCAGVLCFGLGVGWRFGQLPDGEMEATRANQSYLFLGLATFAAGACLAFFATQGAEVAVPLALAATPVVSAGLALHRRLAPDAGPARTGATGVSLGGTLVLVAAVVLAWTSPTNLLIVCCIGALVLALVAVRQEAPYLHAAAVPCLGLAALVAFFLLRGDLGAATVSATEMLWSLLHPDSALVLTALAVLLAGVAEMLIRAGRRADAMFLAASGLGLGVIALWLAGSQADEPGRAAIVYLAQGGVILLANGRWRREPLSYLGQALLLAGTVWLLMWGVPGRSPLWGLVLACETLALALLALWQKRREAVEDGVDALIRPCAVMAVVAGVCTVLAALVARDFPAGDLHSATALLLVAACLAWTRATTIPVGSWAAAALTWAGLTHFLGVVLPSGWVAHPWLTALLATTTLLLTARLVLDRFLPAGVEGEARCLRAAFAEPFAQAVVVGTLLALPGVLTAGRELLPLGLHLAWLAGLWLALAWVERSAGWLTAAQASLAAGVVALTGAWVQERGWDFGPDGVDPRCLQAVGITLGLLNLIWLTARQALRSSPTARTLFSPPWPAFDRLVSMALPVGALLVALWGVLPGLDRELYHGTNAEPIDPQLYGPGAWLLLGVLAALLTSTLWDRDRDLAGPGLMLLGLTIPGLLAAMADTTLSTASALRWGLGIAFLILSIPLWWRGGSRDASLSVRLTRGLLIAGAVGGVMTLTIAVADLGFTGRSPAGPMSGTFFASIGWTASNIAPLALTCLGLTGHGVRERRSGYLLAAGVVAVLSTTGGYALAVVTGGEALGEAHWMHLGQIGALTAAVWAALWLIHAWLDSEVDDVLLGLQSLLGLAGCVLLAIGPVAQVLLDPAGSSSPALTAHAGPVGWAAWALSLAVAVVYCRTRMRNVLRDAVVVGGLLLGVLLACLAGGETSWPAYHVLVAGWSLVGLAVIGKMIHGALRDRDVSGLAAWAEVLASVLIVLALRGGYASPARPWSTAGPALVAALVLGAVAVCWRLPSRVYFSGAAVVLAGVLAWIAGDDRSPDSLALTVSLGLGLSGVLWAPLILYLRKRSSPIDLIGRFVGFPHIVSLLALALLVPVSVGGSGHVLFAWATWAVVGLALAVLLWDEQARFAPTALYGWALTAIVLLLRCLDLDLPRTTALAALLLTALLLGATAVARLIGRWSAACERLGLATWVHWGQLRGWFVLVQSGMAGVVLLLGLGLTLGAEDWVDRLAGVASSALLLFTGVYFAVSLDGRRQELVRRGSLLLGPLVLVEAAWLLLDPVWMAGPLHHTAAVVWSLVLACVVYRFGVRPTAADWLGEARRLGTLFGSLGVVALGALLVLELRLYNPELRRTALSVLEVTLAALAAAALIVLATRAALAAPGPDEKLARRTKYVYAAEVMLVLLFTHVRLNVPLLRRATAVEIWPFAVMVLAFFGVGLAELFRRRRLEVLAVPLHRTGLFLPLLPLLAFWLRPTPALLEMAGNLAPGLRVLLAPLQYLPEEYAGYAVFWFVTSVLLLLIALARQSFGYMLAAALASNVGLWMVLAHHGLGLGIHPQLWLVPLALIVLVSEHLNRDSLRHEQRLALRYTGLLLLYVSSTADMFINGIADAPLLPVVLAVLAVAGILMGIVMRVRAFLLIGSLFLLIDVLSMIWHAAVDRTQTWVWYVSGIVLGAIILALFAVFEKRRDDVMRLVEQIKHWD